MQTEIKTGPVAKPSPRRIETTPTSYTWPRLVVNPALIKFARRVRSLDAMPRHQAVRHVAEILPVVLAWLTAQSERRQHGP